MATSLIIKSALAVARGLQTIGGAATVVELGEVALRHTGVIDKDLKIIPRIGQVVLEIAGFPQRPPAIVTREIKSLGDGGTTGEPKLVCIDCQVRSESPMLSGAAGESFILGRCEEHEAEMTATASRVESLYLGWAKAWSVGDVSSCGKKPQRHAYLKQVLYQSIPKPKFKAVQDDAAYYKALAEWQVCVQQEKEADAAQKQAVQQAKAAGKKSGQAQQQKLADWAVKGMKTKYEKDIAALNAEKAATQDAAKQAEIQAKLDVAEQKAAIAEKLAADMKSAAQDEQLAKLQSIIAAQAQKPGGMDEFFKLLLMSRLTEQTAPPTQEPYMASSEMMMQSPVIPWAPSPDMFVDPAGGMDHPDMYQPESFMYAGHANAHKIHRPEVQDDDDDGDGENDLDFDSDAFPYLAGVKRRGDAYTLFGLAQTGDYDPNDLVALANELNRADEAGLSGCDIGACGLR